MSIIGWLILGGIAGFIASMIIDKSGKGLLIDNVLGIVGAVIGGYVFTRSARLRSRASISTACSLLSSAL